MAIAAQTAEIPGLNNGQPLPPLDQIAASLVVAHDTEVRDLSKVHTKIFDLSAPDGTQRTIGMDVTPDFAVRDSGFDALPPPDDERDTADVKLIVIQGIHRAGRVTSTGYAVTNVLNDKFDELLVSDSPYSGREWRQVEPDSPEYNGHVNDLRSLSELIISGIITRRQQELQKLAARSNTGVLTNGFTAHQSLVDGATRRSRRAIAVLKGALLVTN